MWKDCTDLQIKRGTSFQRNWCFKECGLRRAESMIDLRDIENLSWKKNVNLCLSLFVNIFCVNKMSTLYTSAQSVPNYSLVLTPCESSANIWISAFISVWYRIWLSYPLELGYFITKSTRFKRTVKTSPHLLNLTNIMSSTELTLDLREIGRASCRERV